MSEGKNLTAAKQKIKNWFFSKNWTPFQFQEETWDKYLENFSGLVHASTGTGKTYSVFLGPLIEWLSQNPKFNPEKKASLTILWITPLRALANDIEIALRQPLEDLNIPWTIEKRTGDTSSAVKQRQKKYLPTVLITTPESLSVMLAGKNARELLSSVKCVILDELHELIASKRGVQAELGLARLRVINPQLKIWGLSATIGNVDIGLKIIGGNTKIPVIAVQGNVPKKIKIDTLIPETIERFPWAGHLGIKMIDDVLKILEKSPTSILFTNTRSQSEIWYQGILDKKPEWAGIIAVHHGSIDKELREFVEDNIKNGIFKLVVATSSLDLGVDFSPVETVIQVGSPKGIARILQRAGRSGHDPRSESHLICVPTNALELIEFSAVKHGIRNNIIESRFNIDHPLDVLVQHMVTLAIGEGFKSGELYKEIRTSFSYRKLSKEEFNWALEFAKHGGKSLHAYPEYSKIGMDKEGIYRVMNSRIARQHLMSIGTITSDAMMYVQYLSGNRLGVIEESFIARLKPGDIFIFSGQALEFLKTSNMSAIVKKSKATKGIIPKWMGGRMPLSSELATVVRIKLEEAEKGIYMDEEMQAVEPILKVQKKLSALPQQNDLLIEQLESPEGFHIFIYPFEGRLVHEGLMALFAFRMSKIVPISFSFACNDYGIELLSSEKAPLEEAIEEGLFHPENLAADIMECVNASEMARRQFRDIARIAGLIFQGFPGSRQSNKQIQANSGLLYDVFSSYDPENLLLHQAQREVLERQLEASRLGETLIRLSKARLKMIMLSQPTPMGFPIMVDRLRDKISSEQLADRVRKMQLSVD